MPTVTRKGQVTIPREIRRYLGVGPGKRVSFVKVDGRIELVAEQATPAELGIVVFGKCRSRSTKLSTDRKAILRKLLKEKQRPRR